MLHKVSPSQFQIFVQLLICFTWNAICVLRLFPTVCFYIYISPLNVFHRLSWLFTYSTMRLTLWTLFISRKTFHGDAKRPFTGVPDMCNVIVAVRRPSTHLGPPWVCCTHVCNSSAVQDPPRDHLFTCRFSVYSRDVCGSWAGSKIIFTIGDEYFSSALFPSRIRNVETWCDISNSLAL